jgi:hypothetical protein
MKIEEIADDYLKRCVEICQGGYSKLSVSKKEIRMELMEKYVLDGNKEEVSRLITLCEETIFEFLDIKMANGKRSFSWPKYHESELRNRLSTALQIT